jgi:hypothetical protein
MVVRVDIRTDKAGTLNVTLVVSAKVIVMWATNWWHLRMINTCAVIGSESSSLVEVSPWWHLRMMGACSVIGSKTFSLLKIGSKNSSLIKIPPPTCAEVGTACGEGPPWIKYGETSEWLL